MRLTRRLLIVLLAVAGIAVVLRLTVLKPEVVAVEVARVERGVVEETVTNSRAGTVMARRRARLSPQVSGRVVALPHRKGDRVAQGELLLSLDDTVQRAQVALAGENVRTAEARAAEACLAAELASRELERGRALEADGITSTQTLDTLESTRDRANAACRAARAALDQARAQVHLAETELALTQVDAPFAGVLADVSTELGEWITPAPPGVPIPAVLDLIDTASVYVSAPIDEVDAERVRVGQEARVSIDSRPGEHLAAHLVRVAPFVLDTLEQNRTVEVEASLDDPAATMGLLPGTSADVEVILARASGVLRIPTGAVADQSKVLVLSDGRLVERAVTTGMRNWQLTEIRTGLAEGELVVTSRDTTAVKAGARARASGAR